MHVNRVAQMYASKRVTSPKYVFMQMRSKGNICYTKTLIYFLHSVL